MTDATNQAAADYECEDCIGTRERGCFCKAMGALQPGGPMPSEGRPLFVPCETCGTEGRIYSGSYEDERDEGECPACYGTCAQEVPNEPVTLEDFAND